MTISEYARKHGVTPQAVYKRLSTKGIKVSTLCNKDKTLTEKGIASLDELMQLKGAVNQVENHRSTVDKEGSTVVNRVEELEKLLTAAEHRAELAEQRAAAAERLLAAAEGERDYLREQLSSSIKATALAAAPRLLEEGEGRRSVKNRLVSAWKAWRT